MSAALGWLPSTLNGLKSRGATCRSHSAFSSGSIRPSIALFASCPKRLLSTSADISSKPKFDILFCGSDSFSAASLKALINAKDTWQSLTVLAPQEKLVRVKGVMRPVTGALSVLAKANEIPVQQVPAEGISAYELPETHSAPTPTSLLITASFGHLLPRKFLDRFLPTHALNVHPSLLPRWRGAAPIQWTIATGDKETGVSVQRLEPLKKGVDSGDIVGVRRGIAVPADATYNTLLPTLADIGGELLVEVLRKMQDGDVKGQVQDVSEITRAPKINEDVARIRLQPADVLERLSRGISHQQPIWTTFDDQKIQLTAFSISTPPPTLSKLLYITPGLAALDKKQQVLRLACAPGPRGKHYNVETVTWDDGSGPSGYRDQEGKPVTWLAISRVKPEGRKEMGVMEWWNGLQKYVRAGRLYVMMGETLWNEGSSQGHTPQA